MTGIKQYKTGLRFAEEPAYYNQKFNGRGWNIVFIESDQNSGGTLYKGEFLSDKEIVICARNWKTAQQASNLIYSSLILVLGDTMNGMMSNRPIVYSDQEDMSAIMTKQLLEMSKKYYMSTPGLATACLIALKASHRKQICYAITKYNLSCEIYSTASVDLDPFHSENMKLSPFYEDHIRFASSINLSYSAIEDLKLHIKANTNNPSKLPDGDWNPKVKNDIEVRLKKSGIDLNELLLWNVRGTTRRIDKERPPIAVSKPYRSSLSVRDVEVSIIDALNDVSWIRNKASAHGVSHLTPSLSPYDVANVQHLARRLIMESLGFWK